MILPRTSAKGINKRPNSELGSGKDAFQPLFCQLEIIQKSEIFPRLFEAMSKKIFLYFFCIIQNESHRFKFNKDNTKILRTLGH